MRNLFINYYENEDETRRAEIQWCLEANLSNPLIDRVIMLSESDKEPEAHEKIVFIPTKNRPTYQDFFDLTNDYPDDINVIANSDIMFDKTFVAFDNLTPDVCYAITRKELRGGEVVDFVAANGCPPHFSQDVWAFRGGCSAKNCDKVLAQNNFNGMYQNIPFTMGVPGCDNVIAGRLLGRYRMKNPYKFINCIHVHESQERPLYTWRMTGMKSRWGGLTRVKASSL